MGNTCNVNETELVDIESYCNELSSITGLSVPLIRVVVITNFASVYSDKVSFPDATNNIVNEISAMIQVNATKKKQKKQALMN